MNRLPVNPIDTQQGASTLLITVTILILITLVSFFTGRSVLMEQRITNADFRNKQAFEAAEAGLRRAIEYLGRGLDQDKDNNFDKDFFIGPDGETLTNELIWESRVKAIVTFPDNPVLDDAFPLLIQSKGLSADGSATRTIWQTVVKIDPLPNAPNNPLTTKGTAVIGGAAKVTNSEGNSTIWSGGNVDLSQNNASETNIANPNNANYPACMDAGCVDGSGNPDVIQSSTRDQLGLDVFEYDSNLASLTEAEFFRNFFGLSTEVYRRTMVTQDLTEAESGSVAGMTGEVIWIEGNPKIAANSVIGTQEEPVILIIDGEPTFTGTVEVNGIVMVLGSGNVKGNGNFKVNGAFVASADTTDVSGSLEIMYNSSVLQRTRNSGPVAASPGGWRDFPVAGP